MTKSNIVFYLRRQDDRKVVTGKKERKKNLESVRKSKMWAIHAQHKPYFADHPQVWPSDDGEAVSRSFWSRISDRPYYT